MRTSECVICEFMFDCKGKPTKDPCVNFKDRRKKESNNEFKRIFDEEMKK